MSERKLSSTKQLNKRTSSFFNSEVVELQNNLIVNYKDRNFFLFQQTFHIVIQSDTLRTPGM